MEQKDAFNNLRSSKQRDLIFQILKDNDIHPTADWIYGEAKRFMPTIGVATVYRNLNLLVELGEVERISIPGEQDRFDVIKGEHYHLKCKRCGSITDLTPVGEGKMEALRDAIGEAFGIDGSVVELPRTFFTECCSTCAMENAEKH